MGWRAPLRTTARTVRLLGDTVRGMLDVGHGTANIIVRLSLAFFCFGLILQALSNAADPYRCGALIGHGSWPPYTPPKVDAAVDYEQLESLQRQGRELPPARPFDKWEPAGCRMHEYSRDDIRECLGGKRVLFVGDSTMRVLFFAALTRLEHEAAEWLLRTTFTEKNPRHDLAIDSETVQLQFIWDPWLNSTAFEKEMRHFEPGADKNKDLEAADKPDLVIIGSVGLWAARNAADNMYFDTFRATTDRVARLMSDTVQPFGKQKTPNYVFLAPVQIPRYELLLPGRVEALSHERIARMNNYLGSLPPAVQSHILTAYNDMTYHTPEAFEDTGLHVADTVAERWIDVPLNARCNEMLLRRPVSDQPTPSMSHTTTCCAAYPKPVRGQTVLRYSVSIAVVVPTVIFLVKGHSALLSFYISHAFIGVALLYCYMAEHSHAFAKSERHYNADWLLFSLIVSGICLFASERRHARLREGPWPTSAHQTSLPDVDFLPRHISDEWKGIMQAAILMLVYQDDSKITVVARWTQFVTASYLFLSAFGHASYFLRFGDYSFRRVASVLLRLNLLPSLVATMLDGHDAGTLNSVSHLCSFPRRISFWFLVVYITLRVGSQTNRSRPHALLMRVLAAATILVYVVLRPGPYGVFGMIDRTSQYCIGGPSSWDMEKMRVAIYTDWFAPFAGMVVAIIAQRAAIVCGRMQRQQEQKHMLLYGQNSAAPRRPRITTGPSTNGDATRPSGTRARASTTITTKSAPRYSASDDANVRNSVNKDAGWLDRVLIAILYPDEFTAPLQTMAVIFSSVFFLGFASATTVSPIIEGDISHPYLTTVAVICLAIIRNAHSRLRAVYMVLPVALGTMALELSVLRNHLLLSGNGTGHLRLLSVYPPALEDDSSFGERLVSAKVAAVHSLEVVSIATVFLLVSWHTYRSTRLLSSKLFGENTPGNQVEQSISTKTATEGVEQVLPKYDGEVLTTSKASSAAPRHSSIVIRAGCVLLLFWSLNRFYL